MKHLRRISIAAVSFALLSPVAVNADWGITLGADNKEKQYKNTKDDLRALLNLQYRGDKFNIDSEAISYDFTNSNNYAFEVIAKGHNRGFKAKDNKTFKGMKERKGSFDLGARVILDTGLGPFVIDASKDVASSKGYQAEIKLGGIAPHSKHWTGERKLNIAAVTGLRYQSDKVVNYYYGVKNSETTANRQSYKAGSATTPFIGVEAQLNLTKHVSFNAGLGYERRANSIKNSPLTNNRKGDAVANFGITYWF